MDTNSVKQPNDITGYYSFKSAYESLPKNKMGEVRDEIKKILGVKTNKSVYDRISGRIEIKVSQYQAIVPLFLKNGITIQFLKNE
jgi:hypothetical protein